MPNRKESPRACRRACSKPCGRSCSRPDAERRRESAKPRLAHLLRRASVRASRRGTRRISAERPFRPMWPCLPRSGLRRNAARSQSVISAHSGVIHYVEGKATLDGKGVQPKLGEFPDVKPGQTLAVEGAPTEVLLTPGVFLRLDENSSFRMVSNKLDDTRVEILSGSALIEVGELLQDNAITVLLHDAQIALLKKGLYRFDADPARLRVYDGEARVTSGPETIVAKKGRRGIRRRD